MKKSNYCKIVLQFVWHGFWFLGPGPVTRSDFSLSPLHPSKGGKFGSRGIFITLGRHLNSTMHFFSRFIPSGQHSIENLHFATKNASVTFLKISLVLCSCCTPKKRYNRKFFILLHSNPTPEEKVYEILIVKKNNNNQFHFFQIFSDDQR